MRIEAAAVAALAAALVPLAAAMPGTVEVTPIDSETSLRESTISLSVPEDTPLSWGYVSGGPAEHVAGHPVIIQFLRDGEPVHVAQVEAEGDGSYEYTFRVKSTDPSTGETVRIFSGDYTVKVFRVVPNADARA